MKEVVFAKISSFLSGASPVFPYLFYFSNGEESPNLVENIPALAKSFHDYVTGEGDIYFKYGFLQEESGLVIRLSKKDIKYAILSPLSEVERKSLISSMGEFHNSSKTI